MKKSLLALAILGSFSAAASAQSSVTIYGLLDLGYMHETTAAGSVNSMTSGRLSGSRLGFKGTEDLGNGTSAIFALEAGLKGDTGLTDTGTGTSSPAATGGTFSRQSWVGLTGGFGTIKLGNQYAVILADLRDSIDPFLTGMAGDARKMMASTNGLANTAVAPIAVSSITQRTLNTVTYTTLNYDGFSGQVAYGFGEVAGDSSRNRYYAIGTSYVNGPLVVKLDYENQNNNNALGAGQTENVLLGATYNFGPAKAHFAYGTDKADAGSPANLSTLDQKDWMIGVTVPFGAGSFLASYTNKQDDLNANSDATLIAVGYTYSLSKRTTLYTSYGRLTNDGAAKYAVTTAGDTDKQLDFGIRHSF